MNLWDKFARNFTYFRLILLGIFALLALLSASLEESWFVWLWIICIIIIIIPKKAEVEHKEKKEKFLKEIENTNKEIEEQSPSKTAPKEKIQFAIDRIRLDGMTGGPVSNRRIFINIVKNELFSNLPFASPDEIVVLEFGLYIGSRFIKSVKYELPKSTSGPNFFLSKYGLENEPFTRVSLLKVYKNGESINFKSMN